MIRGCSEHCEFASSAYCPQKAVLRRVMQRCESLVSKGANDAETIQDTMMEMDTFINRHINVCSQYFD